MTKSELRKIKLGERDLLTPEERKEKSAAICDRIRALPAYQEAKTIFLYRYIGSEVQLTALEEDRDRTFVYPVCLGKGIMEAARPTDGWRKGPFGISEPVGERVPAEVIDLIICPCTSFDDRGYRLGMGGGYYDRTLASCSAVSIIAAYDLQQADAVPTDGWDKPVSAVITETRLILRGMQADQLFF